MKIKRILISKIKMNLFDQRLPCSTPYLVASSPNWDLFPHLLPSPPLPLLFSSLSFFHFLLYCLDLSFPLSPSLPLSFLSLSLSLPFSFLSPSFFPLFLLFPALSPFLFSLPPLLPSVFTSLHSPDPAPSTSPPR